MPSGYKLRLNMSQGTQSAAGNWTDVSWSLQIIKTSGSGKWADGPHYWSVTINGTVYSGSIGSYDFRNYTTLTLASGTTRVGHNANGTKTVSGSGGYDDNNTWGVLGDDSVGGSLTLSTLKVPPGTPSKPTATYVSDTQVNLSWTQSSASNGAPQSTLVYESVNGGAYTKILDIGYTTSVSVGVNPNEKVRYKIQQWNSAGFSGQSAESDPVYTTPGAPSNVVATKDAALDITVTFNENVAYSEHNHEVWHGTVTGGVTTWDGAALATLASGVLSHKHVAPDPSKQHVYRVRAKAGARLSAYVSSNTVQLLVAPNKPTVPAMGAYADKAAGLTFEWSHNSVDTTPQTAYEFEWSTNGGSSWTSTGKVVSTATSRTIAANTHAANVALTTRVRTWGSATTGGSDGTGASPWSDNRTVTYKTVPTATITDPTEAEVLNDATLRATLGFSQPEGATFVKAQLELLQGAVLLETLESTVLNGITLETPVQNGVSYTLRARVQDSHGLWSAWDSNSFSVTYLSPVPASVAVSFLTDTGFGQLDLHIPAPGVGESAAATVTITRTINGGPEETVVLDYPVEEYLTFLDTVPTTHGTNVYRITTTSALGAKALVLATLETEECRRAYLSKGGSFSNVVVFGGNLEVDESAEVASDVMQAAGRTKPIGLYGTETAVQLKVSSFVFEGFGSPLTDLRAILLVPGKACYRDPTGRRVFGVVRGSVEYTKTNRGDFSFTLTETS
jgi:hypothetical protein